MSHPAPRYVNDDLLPVPDGVAVEGDPLFANNLDGAQEFLRPLGVLNRWRMPEDRNCLYVEGVNWHTGQALLGLSLIQGDADLDQIIVQWNRIEPALRRDWVCMGQFQPVAARILSLCHPDLDSDRKWAVAISDGIYRRIRYSGILTWHSYLTSVVEAKPFAGLASMLADLIEHHGREAAAAAADPVSIAPTDRIPIPGI